jgi:hypothetical protein
MKRATVGNPKRFVVVSCLHAGSNFSACPPDFEIEDHGERKTFSAFPRQLEVWRLWLDACKQVDDFNPCAVVNLGDSTHGYNLKEYGKDRYLPLDAQTKLAERILEPLVTHRRYLWLRGSGYHTSLDLSLERVLARSVARGRVDNGGSFCVRRFGGFVFAFTHQISGTLPNAWVNQLKSAQAGAAFGRLARVDCVIAGHLHVAWSLSETPFGQVHLCPSFSLLEPSKATAKQFLAYAGASKLGLLLVDCTGTRPDVRLVSYDVPQIVGGEL